MDLDLPYKVEYAAGKDTICSGCLVAFYPGELTLAAMIQSQLHDGKDSIWFHERCFFISHHPGATDQISNFETIKYDDQLKLLMKIDSSKRPQLEQIAQKRANAEPLDPCGISNFSIEYALSNEDCCFVCKQQIPRNELRIKKIDYESDIAQKFGKEILWNHWDCFVIERDLFGFKLTGEMLPGFEHLQPAHMEIIREALPSQLPEAEALKLIPLPKAAAEVLEPKEIDLEELIAKQNAELVRVHNALKSVCTPDELHYFLAVNDSDAVDGIENILDRCADFLTFGALYKCQQCLNGDMIFTKHGYTCNSMIDEWVSCSNFEVTPMRLKCQIPIDLKHRNFFATCEPKVEHRAVRPIMMQDASSHYETPPPLPRKSSTASIKVKNGTAVDPASKLDTISHVYADGGSLYTSVLGLTDIQKNKNSYYKLQILEADGGAGFGPNNYGLNNYWVFSSWGRTGTDIGDSKVQNFASADLACTEFERLYQEQTGNEWKSRVNFRRFPGKFYPIDVSYSDDLEANTNIASNLSPQVGDLMKLVFNVKDMRMATTDFKLDMQKMPLGKLSTNQLQSAFTALNELENAVETGRPQNDLIGLSNKFFTLVPHNFGLAKAPILDTVAKVYAKREIVDSLLDIQNAYAMMQQGNATPGVNSFEAYYRQLNANIVVLDRNSDDYKMIQTYSQNTQQHGVRITIEEAFKVTRHGEEVRYAPFKKLHNRMLLWHGSRTTNFASIISNGLKIAPVVNGSMFGRGIYFADMIGKSAKYCQNPDGKGLLALCEVALGTMNELTQAANVTKLPSGMHSVKGIGQTCPDITTSKDGVIVPMGQPKLQNNAAYLHFNEYIVYNEAQVNMKYLVKVKFG